MRRRLFSCWWRTRWGWKLSVFLMIALIVMASWEIGWYIAPAMLVLVLIGIDLGSRLTEKKMRRDIEDLLIASYRHPRERITLPGSTINLN